MRDQCLMRLRARHRLQEQEGAELTQVSDTESGELPWCLAWHLATVTGNQVGEWPFLVRGRISRGIPRTEGSPERRAAWGLRLGGVSSVVLESSNV